MARIKVWRQPEWRTKFSWHAPRWSVDDGYKTAVADSWEHAMSIARRWAGLETPRRITSI